MSCAAAPSARARAVHEHGAQPEPSTVPSSQPRLFNLTAHAARAQLTGWGALVVSNESSARGHPMNAYLVLQPISASLVPVPSVSRLRAFLARIRDIFSPRRLAFFSRAPSSPVEEPGSVQVAVAITMPAPPSAIPIQHRTRVPPYVLGIAHVPVRTNLWPDDATLEDIEIGQIPAR